jgi:hypothetical protein
MKSYHMKSYETCQQSVSIKSALITHISTVHDNKKLFQCKICQQSFGSKST